MRHLLLLLVLACCALPVHSQTTVIRGGKTFVFDTTRRSIIVDLRGGGNVHLASDLRCLNDGACTPFQGGSGINFGLSLGLDQEITSTLWWMVMGGLDVWSNRQAVRDGSARVRDYNNNVVPLVRELALETSGLDISIAGGLEYRRDAWRMWCMPSLMLAAGAPTWRQTATIISPENILYPNGSRIDETVPKTAIPDALLARVGARIGVGRDIDVSSLGLITPSLQIDYSPMPIRSGTAWTDIRGSLGVSVRFRVDDLPDSVEERRQIEVVDTIIARRTGLFDRDFLVKGRDRIEYDTTRDGFFRTITQRMVRTDTVVMESKSNELITLVGTGEAEDKLIWRRVSGKAKQSGPVVIDTINVRQLQGRSSLYQLGFNFDLSQSESVFMVLPAVFFDAGSSEIPQRYRMLRVDETDLYSEYDEVRSQDDVNRDALNIIGSRLRRGNASITVHGHLDSASDGSDCSLALQRALAIRSYFVNVWRIDSSRVSVQWDPTNCQPELVSASGTDKGQQENRRVDLIANSIEPYFPVQRIDRSTTFYPSVVQLPMRVESETDLSFVEWSYEFRQGKKTLWARQGSGFPDQLVFTPLANTLDSSSKTTLMSVVFTLITESNGTRDTLQTALRVPLVANISNQKFTRLSLATFDISSSTLSERDRQLLTVFMSRLDKGDRVVITGYSDDLGEREANLRLSQRRADVVAEAARQLRPDITIRSTRGVGSREFPSGITSYNNPEERFLSRVVQLSIVD